MTTIEKIAKGRGLPSAFLISFVTPAGVMALPTDDGAYVCRCFLVGSVLHVDDPEDGLISEMVRGREPIPWQNSKQRQDALEHIRDDRHDLDEELRDRLLAHIKATSWYE